MGDFKSGYVAIVGRPNVGKSTLLNALLGTKLSIVSPRPQTTRESILGIYNSENVQMIFVDTPGWLNPQDSYQSSMKKSIVRTIYDDADVLVWIVEPNVLSAEDHQFGQKLVETKKPLCIVINKMDLSQAKTTVEQIRQDIQPYVASPQFLFAISAKNGNGIEKLRSELLSLLPVGQPFYPTDQLTDRWERFYVAELIREEIFHRYQQEIPHASTVLIDEFIEKPGRKDVIRISIVVETEGQMKIMVGQKGRAIRDLGQSARKEIEARLGRAVFLEMKVKVLKNWRKNEAFLEKIKSVNL